MEYDLIIKNGLVILPSGEVKTDIGIKDEKIAAIGNDLGVAKEVIDAKGMVVSPGMVDPHVHLNEPGGGIRDDWEGYETGTRACAKGGVTAFIEMPLNQIPATTNKESLEIKLNAGKGKLHVDGASFGGLTPYNIDGGIQELDEAGVHGYKAFTATVEPAVEGDFKSVDDYSLYEGMRQISKTNKVLAVHCENAATTDRFGEIAKANGETSMSSYVDSRPIFTEVEAIRRVILFAKETGCRVHICHIACTEGLDEVIKAQEEGLPITGEACNHNLYFYKEELNDIGTVAKCSPPIREKEIRDKIWEYVLAGKVSFVVSDHSPSTAELKKTDNAFEAWGGISGLQNTVDVFYDEAVQKRGMSLKLFADMIAKNAADLFDVKGKGQINVSYDADFVLIKPNSPYEVTADGLEYRNKISPYIGRTVNAQIARTILRGKTIYSLEDGVTDEATGEFIFSK